MRRFGIDLGTTNTCIFEAYFPTGTSIEDFQLNAVNIQYENYGSIVNLPRENSMPSVIYGRKNQDSKEYEFFLGKVATMMAARDKNPDIINTKRLLSREDPQRKLQYGLTAQAIAQKLLEGCRYSIDRKHPNQKMLRNAQYCITQPAAFGLFASTSIRDAAIPAGFDNHKAQREPIAALLSFLYYVLSSNAERLFEKQRAHKDRLLTLVVDIGGGTTDVAIQEINVSGTEEPIQGHPYCTGYKICFLNQVRKDGENDAPVASANTEPAFGGLDFDKTILQHVVDDLSKRFFEKFGRSYSWESLEGELNISNLYHSIQDFKISLSLYNPEDLMPHEVKAVMEGEEFSSEINSRQVYEWTQPLCQRPYGEDERDKTVYGIIVDTISRSGYNIDDIDYMFITGGMSSFHPIRQMLKHNFRQLDERDALHFSDNPLEDIAKGAAVCDCFFEVEMPQTILYADLMIDDPDGVPRVLVKKNSPLPVEDEIPNFMRIKNPANLYVDVLWGRNPMDCRLRRLRRLQKPLPKIVPKDTKVSVKYKIDVFQAMDVELTVHAPDEDVRISLLKLIRDADLIRRDE